MHFIYPHFVLDLLKTSLFLSRKASALIHRRNLRRTILIKTDFGLKRLRHLEYFNKNIKK